MIDAGWKELSLGEVLTLQRGFDLPHRARQPGSVPIVSSSGISDRHSEGVVSGPGVVTGRYGTIGQVFFIDEGFWPLNTTLFVRDFKRNDPLFISFLLRTIDFQSYSGKTGVPGVNRNDLHQIAVRLPPLPEQHAIAATLSEVDALIAALDRLIAKKRAIKRGAMQQLLTGKTRLPGFSGAWQIRTFAECFDFLPTGSNSRSELSKVGDTGYIHYGDIHTKWSLVLDCAKDSIPSIQEEKVRNLPTLKNGDLVIADASEDYEGLGASVEIKNVDGREIVSGLHTLLLRGDRTVVADGYKAYITTIQTVKEALIKIATGISVFGISKTNLKSIEIPLPPTTAEQQAIATILSDMDAEIAALARRRDKTIALKQGMMQELLTGRIRLV